MFRPLVSQAIQHGSGNGAAHALGTGGATHGLGTGGATHGLGTGGATHGLGTGGATPGLGLSPSRLGSRGLLDLGAEGLSGSRDLELNPPRTSSAGIVSRAGVVTGDIWDPIVAERTIGNGDRYFDGREYTVWDVQKEMARHFGVTIPFKLLDEERFFGVARPEGVTLGRAPSPALRVAAYHESGHVLLGHVGRPQSLPFERHADFFAGYMHGALDHVLFDDSVAPFWSKPVLPFHDGPKQRIDTLWAGYRAGQRDRADGIIRIPELPESLRP